MWKTSYYELYWGFVVVLRVDNEQDQLQLMD